MSKKGIDFSQHNCFLQFSVEQLHIEFCLFYVPIPAFPCSELSLFGFGAASVPKSVYAPAINFPDLTHSPLQTSRHYINRWAFQIRVERITIQKNARLKAPGLI